jgi:hypothetical protein
MWAQVGAKSKAFESGTSIGGRQKPSLTLDSSEDDSDSAKDPFADDGEYDWGGVGDDAIVPDGQDYGIIPDLASCLPRNSPSLKVRFGVWGVLTSCRGQSGVFT